MEEQLTNDAPFTSEGGLSNTGIKPNGVSQKSWDTYNYFYNYAKNKGDVHPEVFASQAALESNWFNKTNGNNNYFGKQAVKTEPHTKINGIKYRDYPTLDNALSERFDRYSSKYQHLPTSREAINSLSKFPSNKNYNIELDDLMTSMNLNLDTPKTQYEEPIAEVPVNTEQQQVAPELQQVPQQDIPQESIQQGQSVNIPQEQFNYNADLKASTDNNLELATNNSVKNLKDNNPVREYADGGYIDPPKKATRQDSLNLYNNSRRVENFYRKNKYKETPPDVVGDLESVTKLNQYSYDNILKRGALPVSVNNNGDPYYNSNGNVIKVSRDKYKKNIDDNRYYQRETANSFLNLNAPIQLFDKRIDPVIQKGFFKGVDAVNVLSYNSIANKPFDLLTEEEKKERVQKYGRLGVPKSYGNIRKIGTTTGDKVKEGNGRGMVLNENFVSTPSKPRIIPLPVNKLESSDLVKSNNTISTDSRIITPFRKPKSYKIHEETVAPYGLGEADQVIDITDYEVNDPNNINLKKINGTRTVNAQYANGGEIDPPIKSKGLSPSQQAEAEADANWTNNWNANRVIGNTRLKGYQIPSNQIVESGDLSSYDESGRYDPNTKIVTLDPTSTEQGVPAHEYAHIFQNRTKLTKPKTYNDYINKPIIDAIPNTGTYETDPNEIHSELMRLRRNSNYQPDQVITPSDVENIDLNQYNLEGLDKNSLIKLLNSTASINTTANNYAAYGGSLNKSSSDSLNEFNVGGSHESNPLGGIPQGVSSNGKMNTVEQGETSHMIDGKKFIFSHRILI